MNNDQTPEKPIVEGGLGEQLDHSSGIHTLEGDLFAAMKDENYGNNIVKIVTNPGTNSNTRFGSTQKSGTTMEDDKKTVYKKYVLYGAIACVILAGAVIGTVFYINSRGADVVQGGPLLPGATSTATTTPTVRVSTLLNPEAYQVLSIKNLDKNGFIREINKTKARLRDSKINPNTNVGLTLDVDAITFFEKIRYSGPNSLMRSFLGEYAFGLFVDKTGSFEPYILLKVNSYDLAFAGLLEWEPFVPSDLRDIFTKEKLLATSTTATTSATSSGVTMTKSGEEKRFADQVIKNIDTRVYTDSANNLTVVYGIINKEYLLITAGVDSFIDIRNKLLSKNILR